MKLLDHCVIDSRWLVESITAMNYAMANCCQSVEQIPLLKYLDQTIRRPLIAQRFGRFFNRYFGS
jgi:hypothetical protein